MTFITVPGDINRTSPNQRLYFRERARLINLARTAARIAWIQAGRPFYGVPVTVSILVRRARVIDADNALACCKPYIDGIFCGNATPDDSAKWVEFLPIQFETGKQFLRKESVTFTIAVRETP